MELITIIVGVLICMAFVTMVLFVLFGQVTVRKLRKNPSTKDELGVEFMSGWDIINVAQALAFPKSWSRKLERSPLSSLHAKASLLMDHTNRFDRLLGAVFYWFLMATGLSGAFLGFAHFLGLL